MNEQQQSGWNIVRHAIEQGRPLNREIEGLVPFLLEVPGQVDVMVGVMRCLIAAVQALKTGGYRVDCFENQGVVEFLQRTESRMLNDLDVAVSMMLKRQDFTVMSMMVSALVSMVIPHVSRIVFGTPKTPPIEQPTPTPTPAPTPTPTPTNSRFGEAWTGYAVQTVERDENQEIIATRTDYFGPQDRQTGG